MSQLTEDSFDLGPNVLTCLDRARAVAERAELDTLVTSAVDRAARHAMRGLLFAQDGDSARALQEAMLADELATTNALVSEALCRVALQSDDATAAVEACGRLAEPTTVTGLWEATEPAILARYWLGVLHERAGRAEEARRWFRRFLEFWGDADPALEHRDWAYAPGHVIADARERLARLGG